MTPVGTIGLPGGQNILSDVGASSPLKDSLPTSGAPASGFGEMLDGVLATVNAKQAEASQVTQSVLMGGTGQLHQSVLAMQEATVSLGLMVEVRNKLVESYQELMRMQA